MKLLFIGPEFTQGYMYSLSRTYDWRSYHEYLHRVDTAKLAIEPLLESRFEEVVLVSHLQHRVFAPGSDSSTYHKRYFDFLSDCHSKDLSVVAVLKEDMRLPGNNNSLDDVICSSSNGANLSAETVAFGLRRAFPASGKFG